MAIDPNIALQYRPPQIESPVQNIGTLMQLRGQTAEIALRQAQVQEQQQLAEQNRLKAEQDRRDLQDASTLQEAMGDPSLAPKIASGDLTPLYGKIQAKNLDAVRTSIIKQHQDQALVDKDTLANRSTALNALAEGIQGLGEDVPSVNANLQSFIQNPANQTLFKNAGIDPNGVPKSISSIDDLKKWEAGVGVAQAVTNKALALKESQAKEAETEANTAKAKAEAERTGLLNKALKDAANYDPSAGGVHPVDKVLPASLDPQLNASYKAAFDAAMRQPPDQNGRRPAVDTILEQAAAHAATLSPALLQNKARTAAAEQNARIPGEVSAQVQIRRAVEPLEVHRALTVAEANRAQTEAAALDKQYNEAKSAHDILGKVLDLTGAGNKAASSALPVLNAEAQNAMFNIKRINRSDIDQAGGLQAGNAYDRVVGWFDHATVGQAIPPNIQEDIRGLHDAMGQQAYDKYKAGLDSVGKRNNAKLEPTFPPPVSSASTAAANASALPAAARAQLKEGHNTTFGNGQVWTLKNGQPVKVK